MRKELTLEMFGQFNGYVSRVYKVRVPRHANPIAVVISAANGTSRDFVFVPDDESIREYPQLADISYSTALGRRFKYIGGSENSINISNPKSAGTRKQFDMTFALVKWNARPSLEFPAHVACIANVAFGCSGKMVREVIPAMELTNTGAVSSNG